MAGLWGAFKPHVSDTVTNDPGRSRNGNIPLGWAELCKILLQGDQRKKRCST